MDDVPRQSIFQCDAIYNMDSDGDDNHKLKCVPCKLVFPNKTGHYIHNKKKHEIKFYCEVCKGVWRTKEQLREHVEAVHNNVQTNKSTAVRCNECAFSHQNEDEVIKHIESTHVNNMAPQNTSGFNEKYKNCTFFLKGNCKKGNMCTFKHNVSLLKSSHSVRLCLDLLLGPGSPLLILAPEYE